MKILFTGGFTLGSVTPLLAVAEELNVECRMKNVECELMWIGTRRGPERKLVQEAGIAYQYIFAPKWRRYFDARNVLVPFTLSIAVVLAILALLKLSFVRRGTKLSFVRPDVIVTAGGFMGVPLVWAGWLLRIPSLLHSQDVRWSLANRLIAPYVKCITYALPDTVPNKWSKKAMLTGNPVREFIFKGSKERGLKLCGFSSGRPTILVIGGGTGAKRLNEIVAEALPELIKKYQIIHLTGRGKNEELRMKNEELRKRYCSFEFVTHEIADLYAAADVVVTRAGMGALTEFAGLEKPMLIVPLPNTHQEDNARYFGNKRAAMVLNQSTTDGKALAKASAALVMDKIQRQALAKHAKDLVKSEAARQVVKEINTLVKQ